jgi:thiol-disulfide isomerase/thioredoxin
MLMTIFLLTLLWVPAPAHGTGGGDTPHRTVNAQGVTLDVYTFEGLRPLLHRDNDTTYVVNFWATWCAPCVKELPYFERLRTELTGEPVQVVLVSLDFRKQLTSRLIPFIRERGLESRIVVLDDPDANAWIDRVSPEWSGAIPATLIYRGKRRVFYEQSFTYNELEHAVTSFMKGE